MSKLRWQVLQGTLKGYDQMTNLVLHDCQERIYSTTVRHAPEHS